ncbi:Transmembrane protein 62 [Chytriomyces hyalinus]|nr:Transmembrane protein 62 [Chytriomyces hyalinus]
MLVYPLRHAAITALCWAYALIFLYSAAQSSSHASLLAPVPVPQPRNTSSDMLGNDPRGIFTFIQVSDIHVSRFASQGEGGRAHFESFLFRELPAVAPDLLFASGDLVDSKSAVTFRSQQHAQEWEAYQGLLNASAITRRNNGLFYFDMRGNHDCYDTSPPFNTTFYASMSATKSQGYHHLHQKSFGKYTFASLDACPVIGVARPFNFFGILDTNDMNALAAIIDQSQRESHRHVFLATHYPLSTMIKTARTNDGRDFNQLARGASLWVSGHLHRLVGGVRLYTFHKDTDLLELEVGDLKENAVYRIVAVDHDMISFTDEVVSVGDWKSSGGPAPVILVTNPRDARFASPAHEPVQLVRESSHVRVLVYSFNEGRVSVRGMIDGKRELGDFVYVGKTRGWSNVTALKETENHVPMYVASWTPQNFDDGKDHWLHIEVIDSAGKISTKRTVFRVDGLRAKSHGMSTAIGQFIMATNFETWIKFLAVLMHVGIMILVHAFKLVSNLKLADGSLDPLRASLSAGINADGLPNASADSRFHAVLVFVRKQTFQWTLRFLNFSTTPHLFYPFFAYVNYIIVGPWFIADFVPSAKTFKDRTGLFYPYGLWFPGGRGWLLLLDTWMVALWEHSTFIFPLLLILACISPNQQLRETGYKTGKRSNWQLFALAAWLLVTVYFGYYATSYNLISVVVSPGKVWMCGWVVWVLARYILKTAREDVPVGGVTRSDLERLAAEEGDDGERFAEDDALLGG